MTKIQNPKQFFKIFKHLNFKFVSDLEFSA